MSSETDLIRAILREDQLDDISVRIVIQSAHEFDIDVLDYCVHRLGVPPESVWKRAADWAGLAFEPCVPEVLLPALEHVYVNDLSEQPKLTVRLPDGTFYFCSPDFERFLDLHQRIEAGAVHLKDRYCIMPPSVLRRAMGVRAKVQLTLEARQRLSRKWPLATAGLDLGPMARWTFALFMLAVLLGVSFAPVIAQPVLTILAFLVVAAPAMVRLMALRQIPSARLPLAVCPEPAELPRYTIILPLRDEAQMVPQLYAAIARLEYPPEKLEVLFVVESGSPETLAAVEPCLRDPRCNLIEVPDSLPRTKPKAMNYALPFASGDLVVVYDAEDRPAPDQLWRAALRFRDTPDLACLQAELVIDNGRENWLTAMFAGEYAALFGIILPAHTRWRVPVPLGGTSNHFRTAYLMGIGGWDAFNVTEDADLGVRLSRQRMRVETLASPTYEEAPDEVEGWMSQRGRWIKGWMLTFISHNRRPVQLARELGWRNFLFFELVVLGMILAPVLHVFFAGTALIRLALDLPVVEQSDWFWAVGYLALFVLGNTAAIAAQMAGLSRRGYKAIVWMQLTLPLYWLLLALATMRALHELLFRPFHWSKSTHRLARVDPLVGPAQEPQPQRR